MATDSKATPTGSQNSRENIGNSNISDAAIPEALLLALADADLFALVRHWPRLSAAQRHAIRAILHQVS